MISLFTLDGHTLDEFGLVPQSGHLHSIAPDTVDRTKAIAGRPGLYDFGSTLNARMFSFPLTFAYEANRFTLQEKIRSFAAFLVDPYGRPREMKLTLSYEPSVEYTVKYAGSLSPERLFSRASFVLPLVAYDPFARSITGSDEVIMNSYIILNSYIRLNDSWNFSVKGTKTVEVNNWGTLASKPEIIVSGSFTTLTISANGKTFGYGSPISGQTLMIDSEKMTVKLDGNNALSAMTGDFPVIFKGVNNVSIGGTGLNCSVSFNFHPKYV